MKTFTNLFRALRIHQWVKNVLVFVPVLTAHQLDRPAVVGRALIGALAFCLISSAVYVINDLCDAPADRNHPAKKNRPFAAGALKWPVGALLIMICVSAALAAGVSCSRFFEQIILAYFFLNLLYSALLKKEPALDVVMLAGFYTLRLFAGGVAAGIQLSVWLLVFAMFFFFGLALVKRYAELLETAGDSQKVSPGRGYLGLDLSQIGALGVSSGMISVLVLALYVSSPDVGLLYHKPRVLLLLCPLLMYWLGRIWTLANRGRVTGDPVVFALEDLRSYAVGVAALGIIYYAT